MSNLTEKAQEAFEVVLRRFESGDLGPMIELAQMDFPDDAPARNRTMLNGLWGFLMTGSYDTRTYKQWQAVGRQVKRDEVAGFILGPRNIRVDEVDAKGKKTGKKKTICVGFRAIAVFAYNQTEGEELEFYAKQNSQPLPPLMEVAERLGIKVEYGFIPGAYGSFAPGQDKITMGAIGEGAKKVWWHELAHAVHKRVDDQYKKRSYAEGEVIAELTAAVLAEMYGFNTTGYSWNYIKHYTDDPFEAIKTLTDVVEAVLGLVLNTAKEAGVEFA